MVFKQAVALTAREPTYDIVDCGSFMLPEYVPSGLYDDISDLFPLDVKAKYMDGIVEAVTIDGKVYAAPRINGCTRLKALFRVVMPLSAPGLAAPAIYVFISSTNEFLFAMIFASTYKSKTIPVALADMVGKYQIRYGDMTAGAVIAEIFPVILALIFQKYLLRGLTAGGIKG